jgi:hypothetical protein
VSHSPRPRRDPLLIALATLGALGGLIGGAHGLGWI